MAKDNGKLGLMDVKVDFVFKSIFGDDKHPEVLIGFLNAVFGYTGNDRIVKVVIENPNMGKRNIEDKYSILDIMATANDNTIINIEIQIQNPHNMIPRSLYYLSRMVAEQLEEGENYNELKNSAVIDVLDFQLFPDNKRVHNTFLMKEKYTNEVLTDLIQMHFLELAKLRHKGFECEEALLNWLMFINDPESEEVMKVQESVPEIREAMNILQVLSYDKDARAKYESRQKALKDRTSMLEGSKQEGLKEGIAIGEQMGEQKEKRKIAANLLKNGLPEDIVAQATGLTIDEVKHIKGQE